MRTALVQEFPTVKERLYQLETKEEKETLKGKFQRIGKVLENGIFDVARKNGSVRLLFQSLGVKYHDNDLSFSDSNKHMVPVHIGDLPFTKAMEKYVSNGFGHLMDRGMYNKAAFMLIEEKVYPNLHGEMA